jgi:hypothetical protein
MTAQTRLLVIASLVFVTWFGIGIVRALRSYDPRRDPNLKWFRITSYVTMTLVALFIVYIGIGAYVCFGLVIGVLAFALAVYLVRKTAYELRL